MTAITFDTLKFVETLKAGNFTDEQPHALSSALKEAQEARLDELATKRDSKELELKIAEMETPLIKWVVGVAGITIAAIKLLP
ncbi:MAG: hypothetical protein HQL68_09050 [Magnetococcales bacterium]|nr:hypothetical protein [Magnetococcales bacterium]